MTYKKITLFEEDLQNIAEVAKVMSHPARLAILRYLAKCKSCISGDISNEIPLSRTTVSQHLQELKRVKLIKGEINGLKVNYCLNNKRIDEVKLLIDSFFNDMLKEDELNCKK